MKIAVQLGLLPGNNAADKAKWAKDHGVEGIELGVWGSGFDGLRRDAEQVHGIVPVSSVCGNSDPEGNGYFHFLDPDIKKRKLSIEYSIAILKICGEYGAAGQIVPPIFGPPLVPDLSPFISPLAIEDKLMVAACQEIGPIAAEHKTLFMLEPLNRYEQHYLRKQSDGVRIIKEAGVPGIGLLSDLFHMHIEELSTPGCLTEFGAYTSHLHLADNTRMEPGTGDIDFVAAFKPLVAIGFSGYMAYECGITGDSSEARAANLAKSLQFVRDAVDAARKG